MALFAGLPRILESLPECLRRSLPLLFDKNFVKGLQIVDKGGVSCFVADRSRREAFQVPLCSAAAVESGIALSARSSWCAGARQGAWRPVHSLPD